MAKRSAMTIRFPPELVERAREVRQPEESLNDLIVAATEREVELRRIAAVHRRIKQLHDEIEARTGIQPSSVPLIRALREGRERRD